MSQHQWVHRIAPWIAPIFVIIWSTGFIVARYGMPHSEPMTFLTMRFSGVLVFMLPIVLIWKAPWPSRSQMMHHLRATRPRGFPNQHNRQHKHQNPRKTHG